VALSAAEVVKKPSHEGSNLSNLLRRRDEFERRCTDRALAALESSDDGAARTSADPADWSHMPDEELLRFELRRAVEAAVRELPEIYREPVILRDFEGLTTEEASTRLKVKDQTLKSRLHRGRLLLRERLQAFASGLTLHRPTPAYS